MRGTQKGNLFTIELGVVMVLAIMWWSSLSITPSSAQQQGATEIGMCWLTIADCITSHANDTSNPKFDPSSPSFNISEYLCCPLINQTAQNDKPCYCSISTFLHQNPAGSNVTLLLTFCNATTSLDSFDAFCAGSMPPTEAPMSTMPLGNLPSINIGLRN